MSGYWRPLPAVLLPLLLAAAAAAPARGLGACSALRAPMRLRGGTGQGGPSRGFRSKGSNFKWRHPSALFDKQQARRPEPKPREFLTNRKTGASKEGRGRATAYQSKFVHSKRSHQPWYIKFTTARGKRWLQTALKDKAFALGFGAQLEPDESLLDYDYKALQKVPRAFKVGKGGYGRPAYDFTNRYVGGPGQM